MQVLLDGIYDKFTGTTGAGSLYMELEGRMHFSEAPQESTYPYGVYHLISDVPEYVFDTSTVIENTLIQFNLYDDNSSATDINTAYSALITLYDWCSLTMSTGYTSIYMQREFSFLTKESDIWNYMTQYRLVFQKG